ncbi:MAG TPA: hypothetical protein DEW22_06785 [Clostridiales bacterium]|nr:hypothetical protein [Clostridiales bacterium]
MFQTADIEENLKRGILEMLILKMLSKEDMYGYQITEKYDILRSTTSSSEIYTGNKTIVCKDENGNVEWEYILSAEFNVVEGVSSTCTNVSYAQNIYKSVWSFSDGGTSKSGNTAYGYGTFKRKALFITLEEQIIDLAFTCDLYGNLS